MIRGIILLLAGFWLAMTWADRLPEAKIGRPRVSAAPVAAPVATTPQPVIEPATPAATPAPSLRLASASTVPFSTPTPVTADGHLQDTAPVAALPDATDSPPEPVAETPVITRYVAARSVNVRAGPSTGNGVIGRVLYADIVEILSDPDAPWVRIRIQGDGIEGYMAARFLQETPPG